MKSPFAKSPRKRAALLNTAADAARDRREWNTAAAAYAAALRLDAGRQPLWVQLGHMRKEAGDLEGAERAYGRALQLAPDDADTWLNVGHLMKLAGRPLDAARAFAQADVKGSTDEGLGELRERLRRLGYVTDDKPPKIAQEEGEPAEAPPGDRRGGRRESTVRVAEGDAARDRQDWRAAARAYAASLEADPAQAHVWVQLGHMRKESGDYDGAETAYGQALGLRPDDWDTWLNVGLLFKLAGRTQAAADAYAHAARLGATSGEPEAEVAALAVRGTAANDTPPVVGEWRPPLRRPTKRAQKLKFDGFGRGGERRRDARRLVVEGDAARDRRDWPAAAAAYHRALQSRPEMAHIQVQLGHALKETGDHEGAEGAYREALRLEPDNGDTHLNLGHLYKVAGRHGEALAAYRRAVEVDPERGEAAQEVVAAARRMEALEGTGVEAQVSADPLVKLLRQLSRGGAAAAMVAALPPAEAARLAASLAPAPSAATPSAGPSLMDVIAPQAEAAAPDLWFDVSDLMAFFTHSRLPTGIQRVQIEAVSAAFREPAEGARLGVCVFSEASSTWSRASAALFQEVARLALLSGDSGALDWRLALGRLELSLTVGGRLEFKRGDVLVNLGAAWAQGNYYLALRAEKARCGLLYTPCMFDLIPVLAPGFHVEDLTRDFLGWLQALLSHADGVFAISHHTLEDLRKAAVMIGAPLPGDREEVIPLDAVMTMDRDAPIDGEVLRKYGLTPGEFVLFVSTIEPRKGHLTAFGAWEAMIRQMGPSAPKLVCVGRLGWMQDATVARLNASPALRDRVQIASGVSDRDLHSLYKACTFTLYASVYEGWGLPITESLTYGKVPLTSDHPSVVEAGAGFAELFETGSERKLAAAASRLWSDRPLLARLEQRIAAEYRPRRWEEIGAQVVAAAHRWRAEAGDAPRATQPFPLVLGRHHSLGRNRRTVLAPELASGEAFRRGTAWWGPEWWGCWTKAEPALLSFTLRPTSAPLRIYLGLRGAPGHASRYRIALAGDTIAEGRLDADAVQWICRTLPATAGETGEMTLMVAGDAAWPMDGGPEPRLAGLGVTGFMVCEEGDLLARSAFVEEHMSEKLALLA